MLVLTRRTGEEIVIGDVVRVTVVEVKGNEVRLGVTAPASVRVDRQEVHERRMQFDAANELVKSPNSLTEPALDLRPQRLVYLDVLRMNLDSHGNSVAASVSGQKSGRTAGVSRPVDSGNSRTLTSGLTPTVRQDSWPDT